MAGNTRGKLKEHFEGIHRNLDWCIHHINSSLALIDATIRASNMVEDCKGDETKIQAIINEYPLFKGVTSLGIGLKTLDDLAKGIYEKL